MLFPSTVGILNPIGSKFKNPVIFEALKANSVDTFSCGSYNPEICNFIVNKWVKWLGRLVHHTFSVDTKICCTKDSNCTVKKVFELMISKRKFVAPAYKDRDSEIVDGGTTELYGPNLLYSAAILSSIGGYSAPLIALHSEGARFTNPVKTKVFHDAKEPKIINYTMFPHIFYPGTITRTIIERGDGIYVETRGEGDAVLPLIPLLNIIGGEAIFKSIDEDMIKNWTGAGNFNSGGGGVFAGGGATGSY